MKLEAKNYYRLLVRTVGIVTTISRDGKVNAAPFSFNTPISFSPPLYGFACNPDHDTWVNVKKTGEFVVNVACKDLGESLHILETDFPHGINELEKARLNEVPAKIVKPPRIKEAIAWVECRLESYFEIGDHIWIVGRVLEAEVKDEFWKDVIKVSEVLCHIGGEFFARNMELAKYKRAK